MQLSFHLNIRYTYFIGFRLIIYEELKYLLNTFFF